MEYRLEGLEYRLQPGFKPGIRETSRLDYGGLEYRLQPGFKPGIGETSRP